MEDRWFLSFELADDTGRGTFFMYHDTAKDMQIFQQASHPAEAEEQKKILLDLKSMPWTIRCVFARTN